MAEKISEKVVSGIKWNAVSVIGTRGTDFLVKLVLARLLMPDAFGVVAMATIITGFLSTFSDMGLFNALVQKKNDAFTQPRYSTAFWCLAALATSFIFCFFLFISTFGAHFYNEPKLVPVLNALSLYLFFNILSIIPRVVLTKQLAFKSLVRITYLGTAVSSVVAITMAVLNFGVWSLVAKSVLGSGIIFLSYWFKVGWRPSFTFQPQLLKDLAGYSFFTQTNSLLFYIRNNLDYIIIGKLATSSLLGIYTLAFTLSETLRSQLYSVFNKVFFPIYSHLQNDTQKIKEYYLKVMRLTSIVTFPLSILLITLPEEILYVCFNEQWLGAAEPLRILAIASMIFAISGTPAEVLKSIGKVSVSFFLNFLNTFLVALPLMYFGLQYFGLKGVAYAVCIHYTISRITYHHFMKKYIGITDREVLGVLLKPIVTAGTMFVTIEFVSLYQINPFVDLLKGIIAGSLVYIFFLFDDLVKIFGLLVRKDIKAGEGFSSRLWKNKPLIFRCGKTTYKIFLPAANAAKKTEAQGNRSALQSMFWKDHVLQVKEKQLFLKMETGFPMCKDDYVGVQCFLNAKLEQSIRFPYRRANELVDAEVWNRNVDISQRHLEKVVRILSQLHLPSTAAHGDLHIHNMIKVDNQYRLIDWSMYTTNGSFITDYIHFHIYNICSKHKESWASAILADHLWLMQLADRLKTTAQHLRVAYAASRITGELTQSGSRKKIPAIASDKYNTVLNNILNESEQSQVQHRNTFI